MAFCGYISARELFDFNIRYIDVRVVGIRILCVIDIFVQLYIRQNYSRIIFFVDF